MRGFDGTNHPGAGTVLLDGFQWAFLYGGTPASLSGKDFTSGQYADYKHHGIAVAIMYENRADDATADPASIEYADGVAHAQALLADLRAKGVAETEPVESTCDEHLTVTQIPQAVQYQAGFYRTIKASGWLGPVGAYGFPEFLNAVRSAGVADWFHGCGSRSTQPTWVNVWQDNTGTYLVGGAPDDVDWILVPLPSQPIPPAPAPLAPVPQGDDDMVFIECPDRGVQALWSGGVLVAITSATAVANVGSQWPRVELDGPTWDALKAACESAASVPAKLDALLAALAKSEPGTTFTLSNVSGSIPLAITASGALALGSAPAPAAHDAVDGVA